MPFDLTDAELATAATACRAMAYQALARLVGSTLPLGTRLVPIRRHTATPVSVAAAGQGLPKRSECSSQASAEGASHGCEAQPELLITISVSDSGLGPLGCPVRAQTARRAG